MFCKYYGLKIVNTVENHLKVKKRCNLENTRVDKVSIDVNCSG